MPPCISVKGHLAIRSESLHIFARVFSSYPWGSISNPADHSIHTGALETPSLHSKPTVKISTMPGRVRHSPSKHLAIFLARTRAKLLKAISSEQPATTGVEP